MSELLSYLRGWWPHWLMLLRSAPDELLYALLILSCLRTLYTLKGLAK